MISAANRKIKYERIYQKMIDSVDSRLAVAASPSSSASLFSNTTANWTSTVFVPNSQCWLQDLRPQLTGVHMYAGGYLQSYAAAPISPRHGLSVSHGGPDIGTTIRFVSPTGTVFTTTILKWINDNPNVGQGSVSDAKQPYVTDLSVYLFEHELPDWVFKAAILPIANSDRNISYPMDPPTVVISQGNWTIGPAESNTPKNRQVYVKSLNLITPRPLLRNPFHHEVVVGDSGSPEFALIDNKLYLVRIVTSYGGSGVFLGDYLNYINSLIKRADASASISTGYKAIVARLPRI